MQKLTKIEKSWILYDCGNSAYSMAITTALLPLFFSMTNPGNGMDIGYFNSFASILVAFMSPVLGTIADFKGQKKRFFNFFALLGIAATLGLAFVPIGNWQMLIGLYVLTVIGFSGSNIFYDAFLVDVSPNDRMDKVSSAGFAYGYIASIIPFGISLAIIYLLGMNEFIGFQIGFAITAFWWLALTIPMIKSVQQVYYIEPTNSIVFSSFKRLWETVKNIRQHQAVAVFLLAYFLYIDGVDTIIKMVVPYAETVLGGNNLDMFVLLGILLIIQIIAFPFALLYGRLAKTWGTKTMIQIGIATYIVAVLFAFFIESVWHIFILGTMIGSAQGGIQALSRSYFAKIIPKEESNEFFGFYNIFGKFAAILGPLLMSLLSDLTNEPRTSILAILPLFIIGGLLTFKLKKV